ncbi:uncharacterized protein MYCFIDRAFT_207717 [Pseudocercospora fijiensis CIRAD86]|uniref:Uncharacterized protein n=1 Tax=Pseudocercospora fijiensis (strain CIRAD86) TaxID=383855 RepID=M3B183_PSEFD|nr:uncharacterized protein MYCFIDRAFT_207717 [Pseudocercospora fijiensis CIRAD86]EME83177.1 hypothetical protein MYCFIDRAFT_207717 [Pseudocercospora fijiensis CIRAD86]
MNEWVSLRSSSAGPPQLSWLFASFLHPESLLRLGLSTTRSLQYLDVSNEEACKVTYGLERSYGRLEVHNRSKRERTQWENKSISIEHGRKFIHLKPMPRDRMCVMLTVMVRLVIYFRRLRSPWEVHRTSESNPALASSGDIICKLAAWRAATNSSYAENLCNDVPPTRAIRNIVVLFPQATVDNTLRKIWNGTEYPGGALACFDCVGWVGENADQKGGVQMAAIVNMNMTKSCVIRNTQTLRLCPYP